jgi:hypothetical protein
VFEMLAAQGAGAAKQALAAPVSSSAKGGTIGPITFGDWMVNSGNSGRDSPFAGEQLLPRKFTQPAGSISWPLVALVAVGAFVAMKVFK